MDYDNDADDCDSDDNDDGGACSNTVVGHLCTTGILLPSSGYCWSYSRQVASSSNTRLVSLRTQFFFCIKD